VASRRDIHPKPRFGEDPRGPLADATGLRDDLGDVVGPSRSPDLAKGGMKPFGGEGAMLRF